MITYSSALLYPVLGGVWDGEEWPHYAVDEYHFAGGDYVFAGECWSWRPAPKLSAWERLRVLGRWTCEGWVRTRE